MRGVGSGLNNGFAKVLPTEHAHEGSWHVLKAAGHVLRTLQLPLRGRKRGGKEGGEERGRQEGIMSVRKGTGRRRG